MRTQSKRKVLGFIASAFVLFVFIALFYIPEPKTDLWIELASNSNSVARLRLSNHGETTVRLSSHCTLYWTNRAAVFTNQFFKHEASYTVLQPSQSVVVSVPSPVDATTWETSFTYSVRPRALRRLWSRITFLLPGRWEPDNSFIGRFGPVITNTTLTSQIL